MGHNDFLIMIIIVAHIKFLTTIICHVCGAMPLTSFGNSLQKKRKKGNFGPWKYFSMMQCLFDQSLNKFMKLFNRSWFFLRSGLPWIIWHQPNDLVFNASQWPFEKTHQVVWDSLLDYERLEWQQTLHDLEKTLDVA